MEKRRIAGETNRKLTNAWSSNRREHQRAIASEIHILTPTVKGSRYVDAAQYSPVVDLTAAVDALPPILPSRPEVERQALPATGTDGKGTNFLVPQAAKMGHNERQPESKVRMSGESGNPVNSGENADFFERDEERPLPDSNRGWMICNHLPYHLAKGPSSVTTTEILSAAALPNKSQTRPPLSLAASASICRWHSFLAAA